jgi:hypothetical protein
MHMHNVMHNPLRHCCCIALQVVVFSWSGCPFCKNAKGLLSDLGANYKAVELDTLGDDGKAIRAELAQVGPCWCMGDKD